MQVLSLADSICRCLCTTPITFIGLCIHGAENVCKLGLTINRMAAKKQKNKINEALKEGPEPVLSALDMADSSDDEQ